MTDFEANEEVAKLEDKMKNSKNSDKM